MLRTILKHLKKRLLHAIILVIAQMFFFISLLSVRNSCYSNLGKGFGCKMNSTNNANGSRVSADFQFEISPIAFHVDKRFELLGAFYKNC